MTARQARALALSQLAAAPARPMVRISRSDAALLVCDALEQASFLRAQGWRVLRRGGLLYLDLPASAYEAMAQGAFAWPQGPWQEPWMEEQAFLALECRRPGPWRGAPSEAILRRALLASVGPESALRQGIAALRGACALALRQGGDGGIRGAALQYAQALWAERRIPHPPWDQSPEAVHGLPAAHPRGQ